MKQLIEKRNDLIKDMENLLNGAKKETRAMNDDENTKYASLKKEVNALNQTIEKEEETRGMDKKQIVKPGTEERAILEERVFANYIRGIVENRADVNMPVGNNGAVIPASIANKIIKKVYDMSPIYQLATRYNIGGTLSIPYYDENTTAISMAYATEFTPLESTSGKFTSIELKGYLAGALTKVSKSLINNSQFDITNFVITAMAESISRWIEKELLFGTTDKVAGLTGVTQKVTAAAVDKVTADELIDLQEEVNDAFQALAIWIMSKSARKAIRKLKDGQGNYLLNKDANARWGYTLLGKDIYASDNMPNMEAGKTTIYYGDMSGLAVKVAEQSSIEVLRERFADQHVIGVISWLEIDAKVENAQKIAKLEMAAGV